MVDRACLRPCDRREQPFVSNKSARERINDREYMMEKEGEGEEKNLKSRKYEERKDKEREGERKGK